MKRLFFLSATLGLFLFLVACTSTTVPQVGAQAPCQIQSSEQVEESVYAGITDQHWEILSATDHIVEVRKKYNQMQATAEIAYGYKGFSIEYQDSKNMDYDVEKDTINSTYVEWAYNLMNAIDGELKAQAKRNPAIKCSEK